MAEGIVLVTGGNSGIGFECARELARRGSRVLIASRNQAASEEAVRRIARESGEGRASALPLDLGSLASVRAFAKEIEARDLPLRALVCNAGLQMNHGPKLTPDGFESTFAVNHLGHFLLVHLLLARLLANAPARIVVVASGVHDPAHEDHDAAPGDHGSRDARRDRRAEPGKIRRPRRLREQQAVQPLVQLRAGPAHRGGGARERRAPALGERLGAGTGAGLGPRARLSARAALPVGLDAARRGPRALAALPDDQSRPQVRRRARARWCSIPRSSAARASTSRRTRAGRRRLRRISRTTPGGRARSGTRACA